MRSSASGRVSETVGFRLISEIFLDVNSLCRKPYNDNPRTGITFGTVQNCGFRPELRFMWILNRVEA